jgi:hypothetical protein
LWLVRVFLLKRVADLLVLRFPLTDERRLVVRVRQVDAEFAGTEFYRIARGRAKVLDSLRVRVADLPFGALITDEHDLLDLPRVDEVDELRVLDLAVRRVGEVDDCEDRQYDEHDPSAREQSARSPWRWRRSLRRLRLGRIR